jgi:hypothetical protein
MSRFRAAVIVIGSFLTGACGIKAPPLPPLADEPVAARPALPSVVPDAGCCREAR